jgi:hypothetical protein
VRHYFFRFLVVFAADLNAFALGAPFSPARRIRILPFDAFTFLRLLRMFAYKPGLAITTLSYSTSTPPTSFPWRCSMRVWP